MNGYKDYHDYVFKNGKLIAEFEEMYKNASNIPWHQNEVDKFFDIKISKIILNTKGTFNSVLEIGCGLGYYLNEVKNICVNRDRIVGIDISQTAIDKARLLFPDLKFFRADIMAESYYETLKTYNIKSEIVIIRGCFWYLFHNMKSVVENIKKSILDKGYLFIHQNFPPLDQDFIGKSIIPNPEALINFFYPSFKLILRNDLNLVDKKANDYWLSIFMRKKK